MDSEPRMPSASQRMRAAIPRGLLGMLVLVLAVERYVRSYDRLFCNPEGWEWQCSSRAARLEAPGCDILCFGDSLTKLGVLPRAIEARTGKRAYNLAASGAEPPAQYFLLRQALEAGSKPSAVVVNFHAPLMNTDPRRHVEMWPYLLSIRECAELARDEHDASLFASLVLARILPTVRFRFPMRTCVKKVLKGETDSSVSHTFVTARLWRVNRGATPATGRRENLPGVSDWGENYLGRWMCDKLNGSYICKFLELARQRHIRVYWLIPPIEPALEAWCQSSGLATAETRFLHALLARFPNLTVVDGRGAEYAPGAFWDRHHLAKQGAVTYSIELGNLLRHDLASTQGGENWIKLPRYRARAADFPVEDLGQAGLALGKAPVVR